MPPRKAAKPPGRRKDPPRRKKYTDLDKSFRFTPERRKRVLILLRATIGLERACERVGCDEKTARDWQRAGRAAAAKAEAGEKLTAREQEQAEFARDFDDAITASEASLIASVQAAAKSDWRAAAWRLATMRPQDYSERAAAKRMELEANASLHAEEVRHAKAKADIAEMLAEKAKKGGDKSPIAFGLAVILSDESLSLSTRQELASWAVRNGLVVVERVDLAGDQALPHRPAGAPSG